MSSLARCEKGRPAGRAAVQETKGDLLEQPNNSGILMRVASGDAAALEECIDRYGGLVWSLARRYCGGGRGGGAAEAEDAVQEIFVSIWENARRFDASIASETTFVAMIARRRLIDRRRRSARRRDAEPMPTFEVAAPDASDARRELAEEAQHAAAVLAQLRPEQKQVLELSLVHGRTYEQIAEATGMPVGTVKTHARRGLIRVREIMSPEVSGDSADSTEARA